MSRNFTFLILEIVSNITKVNFVLAILENLEKKPKIYNKILFLTMVILDEYTDWFCRPDLSQDF